ncbi:DUF4252 domain-containing protein [Capnocytophaga cynodegmi]|uniref:DUF4252 domain-containing protein n=1 Tax=Capnocytophaga cynodegmi TaxID=28189 RepID=A0A0B7HET4_9FLAO|nr:DUF4252 domain-containing protein [Capnocytophaga cynodegmi]CEN35329.1 conserved exported hypothetical protein [Capnocytophaga cynodegmi]CEN37154.1 conserved exported hypothetical protein [Capnocytophaga cynodegmi]CEN41498.1 conserved exported hypothetical protein [Capnocytophaga cynodegmi]
MRILILFGLLLTFASCQQESIQQYIVKNSENPNFVSMNIAPKDFLGNVPTEKENIFNIINRVNFLIFNKNDSLELKKEYKKVTSILKDEKYQDLIRTTNKGTKFQIDYVGTEENIKEVIVLIVEKKEKMALMRILANGLDVTQLSKISTALNDNSVDEEGLKNLLEKISTTLKQ